MKQFFVGAVIVVALLAGVGGLVLGGYGAIAVYQNQPVSAVTQDIDVDLGDVAGYTPGRGDTVAELRHELAGGNTKLIWQTGKLQAGARKDFDGTWDSLGGAVVYDAENKTLKALQVNILIESFNGYGSTDQRAPGGLVNTVLGKGIEPPSGFDPWFNWVDYPQAVFAATEFIERTDQSDAGFANAPQGWTHLIKGALDLNGTESDLAIPAIVAFNGDAVTIDTAFAISRSAFDIVPKNPLPLTEVDDRVLLAASVTATPDAGLVVAGLTSTIGEQGTLIGAQQKSIQELQTQIALLTENLAKLERDIDKRIDPAQPAADLAKLPETYTQQLQLPGKEPVPFDMVLVPGGEGIDPFYMGKHEVTWDMFYNWAYGSDLNANQYAQLQAKNARPSPLYEDCNQLKIGLGKRPAISMSRTTAIAFAKWVSEQTGKTYRLPTDAEWNHALKLGGGVPEDAESLQKQAVFLDNADVQIDPPFLELTQIVGAKKPNALGIHDLLGNAAEWVVDTGGEQIVRGGHFLLPIEAFAAGWKAIEDQDVWNETYPQLPVSKFWYRDHYYQGIRLVADPQ